MESLTSTDFVVSVSAHIRPSCQISRSWPASVHQETRRISPQTQTQLCFRLLPAFPPRMCAVTRPTLMPCASPFPRIAHTGQTFGFFEKKKATHKSTLDIQRNVAYCIEVLTLLHTSRTHAGCEPRRKKSPARKSSLTSLLLSREHAESSGANPADGHCGLVRHRWSPHDSARVSHKHNRTSDPLEKCVLPMSSW